MNLEKLQNEIAADEGCVLEIYNDHLGYPTFGIGHLITEDDPEHGEELGTSISQDRVDECFLKDVETVIALTNDDEDNLMVSVIVEKFSKNKRTMALTNKPNYSLLQSSLKIDDLIDPRKTTVSSILKHIHKGTIENAYTILNGDYEVIEAEIIETSELINKELKDSNLPNEIRIGAILREDKVIIPRSNFIFKKNDSVVLLAKKDQLQTVESMFRLTSV